MFGFLKIVSFKVEMFSYCDINIHITSWRQERKSYGLISDVLLSQIVLARFYVSLTQARSSGKKESEPREGLHRISCRQDCRQFSLSMIVVGGWSGWCHP